MEPASVQTDLRVQKIARFAGLDPSLIEFGASFPIQPDGQQRSGLRAAIVTAAELDRRFSCGDDIPESIDALLILGWDASERSTTLAHKLSNGKLRLRPGDLSGLGEVRVAKSNFAGYFSGLSFSTPALGRAIGFGINASDSVWEPLICFQNHPFFVRGKYRNTMIYLWGLGEIADLDVSVSKSFRPLDCFLCLAPLLMFLRSALPERLWTTESVGGALIVDDPLLAARYGCLDFRALVESMNQHGYSTSVAFIPWNYQRTKPEAQKLFVSRRDRLSICVHGCNHTKGEFSNGSEESFDYLSTEALRRMDEHRRRTGIDFDPVMVFPQGRFSTVAMKTLSHSRFVAAINSTPFATDAVEIPLRHLLEPLCRLYSGFPLFFRRYPDEKRLADFAFDLLLGRPLFLVEHHDYFRDGFGRLEQFLQTVKQLEPNIRWSNPGAICREFHQVRKDANGLLEIRFFTPVFSLKNPSDDAMEAALCFAGSDPSKISEITVDGVAVSWRKVDGGVSFPIRLGPGREASVIVQHKFEPSGMRAFSPSFSGDLGAFGRRHLSEWRDNYIDRREWSQRAFRRLRKIGKFF